VNNINLLNITSNAYKGKICFLNKKWYEGLIMMI
jgi:hypothetical protein